MKEESKLIDSTLLVMEDIVRSSERFHDVMEEMLNISVELGKGPIVSVISCFMDNLKEKISKIDTFLEEAE